MTGSARLFPRWVFVLMFGPLLLGLGAFFSPNIGLTPVNAQSQPQAEMGDAMQPRPFSIAAQEAHSELSEVRRVLMRIESAVETNAKNDGELVKLLLDVEDLSKSVLDIGVNLRPRLTEIKATLQALGPAPESEEQQEPQVIQDQRANLTTERAVINEAMAEAEQFSIVASRIATQISELRRSLFTERLFERTPVTIGLFLEAVSAIDQQSQNLNRMLGSWLSFVWNFKRPALLSSLAVSGIVWFVFLGIGHRMLGPYLRRDPAVKDPPYITRLSVVFWSTVIPTAALTLVLWMNYVALQNFNVLRGDLAPLFVHVFQLAVAAVFIWTLVGGVLAPRLANWRLVNLSNQCAKRLMIAFLSMAAISGVDFLLNSINRTLGAPVALAVARSFITTILIGMILIAISYFRPILAKSGDPDEPGQPWRKFIAIPLRLAGLALIGLALSGYIGLGRFAASQIIMTGAILAIMSIGFQTAHSLSNAELFANTFIGRLLHRRFELTDRTVDQTALVLGLALQFLVLLIGLPVILLLWGFQAEDILLFLDRTLTEIQIGNITISLIGILSGFAFFVVGLLGTRVFKRWLDGKVMARSGVDPGVRNSVRTMIGYVGVGLAALIGISAAGIDLSSLALVAGALSLGIGFGLQTIVSNFVSGLILLAERPLKVGDWVVTGTTEGFVKRIAVRATEIETFDKQSIIVPNSDLINGTVSNWTHRNRLGRVDIPVGVSYDSEPNHVVSVLTDIALANPRILRNPEPMIAFLNFGDSSLDFELRVFVPDITQSFVLRTELRLAIFERFKAEGITIPFPQRDLNIKMAEAAGGDSGNIVETQGDATQAGTGVGMPIAVLEAARRAAIERRAQPDIRSRAASENDEADQPDVSRRQADQ